MRLWHQNLIEKLPRQQLLGQWRECIALLGNGWGRKHKTVDYIFTHPTSYLLGYTYKVYQEMRKRGYNPDLNKTWSAQRKRLTYGEIEDNFTEMYKLDFDNHIIYPEHDQKYYEVCLENLNAKGIKI